MNIEFNNAYQEVLFENLNAILKQNFMFQTQLKITEKNAQEKVDLENKYNELVNNFNNINSQVQQIDYYKTRLEQVSDVHEEKNRIQSALNETMQKLAQLEKQLNSKDEEIENLNSKLSKLSYNNNEYIKNITNKNKEEFEEIIVRNKEEIEELKKYIELLESNVAESKLKKIKPTYIALKKIEDNSMF